MFISITMMIISLITFLTSSYLLYYNMFIYIKIPMLMNLYLQIPISLIIDWMSCMFISTVSMISSMILLFSMYYIQKKEHKQFSMLLMMFVLSMMILIISNNLFLMLLGWDMLGMSSYILVIYYQNHLSGSSGSITLLTNRIGDIMILLSISSLIHLMNWELNMNEKFSFLVMMLLLLASCTKSAQFPFSAWLPMAMSAPTPISALVHSSTLVTAGIYLMIRTMNNIHPLTMLTLMMISSLTALYAGMSANWEQDMKKIIALSTLSQMAMMMFSISIKSIPLAFFHLIIHAYFKSLMFMCAGIMIHESSYQDMRMMNTSTHYNPLTNSILGLTNMALMGFPFTSGFLSKDMIIEKMISSKMECILTLLMILSIGMTSSYSIRMIFLSNKYSIKSKPDLTNHTTLFSNMPITLMSPTTMMMGACLLWMTNPEQIMLMPKVMKFSIIIMLIMGLLLGTMLSFKSFLYKSLGKMSLTLWFIHTLSTKLSIFLYPYFKNYIMNDKHWQENYGPNMLFMMTMKTSSIPELSKSSTLMLLMMISLLPLIIT